MTDEIRYSIEIKSKSLRLTEIPITHCPNNGYQFFILCIRYYVEESFIKCQDKLENLDRQQKPNIYMRSQP